MDNIAKISKTIIFLDKIAANVDDAIKTTRKMQKTYKSIGPASNTKIPEIKALGSGKSSSGGGSGSSSSSSSSSPGGDPYYPVENPVDRLTPGGINAY